MTDETTPPEHPQPATTPTPSGSVASSNGTTRAGRTAVRSGLANRRNPVLVKLVEFAQNARRIAFRDPLALFLLIASIVLAVAFATLLGQIKPGSKGTQVALSAVQTAAKQK
ncbi:MAG TPA: cell division protein FtsH, partial [Solirubrobacteraceae bacterium]